MLNSVLFTFGFTNRAYSVDTWSRAASITPVIEVASPGSLPRLHQPAVCHFKVISFFNVEWIMYLEVFMHQHMWVMEIDGSEWLLVVTIHEWIRKMTPSQTSESRCGRWEKWLCHDAAGVIIWALQRQRQSALCVGRRQHVPHTASPLLCSTAEHCVFNFSCGESK